MLGFRTVLLVALVAAACTSTTPDAAAGPAVQRQVPGVAFAEIDDALSIGVFVDQTGPYAAGDLALLRGVEAEVARVNQSGGVNGVPLALATYDSHGDVGESLAAYRRMRNIDVAFVIVGCDPEIARALSARSGNDAALVVAACPSSPIGEDAERTFDLGAGHDELGEALAAVAVASSWQRIAVASTFDDSDSRRRCDAASDAFTSDGAQVVGRYDVPAEGDDLAARLAEPEGAVDGVLVCVAPGTAVDIANTLRSAGSVPVVFSISSAESLFVTGDAAVLDIGVVTPVVAPAERLGLASGAAAVEVLVAGIGAVDGRPEVGTVAEALLSFGAIDTQIGSVGFAPESGRRVDVGFSLLKTTGFGPLVVGTWTAAAGAPSWSGPVVSAATTTGAPALESDEP